VALTPKRAAFVREYLIDRNATQAALRAGYSPKGAGQKGHELLKNVDIREALEELDREATTDAVVTASELREWWSACLRGEHPDADYRDRQKASEMLAKHFGMFTEKREVTIRSDPREMTTDELEEYLRARGLLE